MISSPFALFVALETQPKSSKMPQASKSKASSASENKRKGQQEIFGKTEATAKFKKEQEMVKSGESLILQYLSVV